MQLDGSYWSGKDGVAAGLNEPCCRGLNGLQISRDTIIDLHELWETS